jgi:hypothetical protein
MRACRLVALGALGCAAALPAPSAWAFVVPTPPWTYCVSDSEGNKRLLEGTLSPPTGSTVLAGSPVTFSGESTWIPTFAVASSPALLSQPDIDNGLGSLRPGTSSSYTFTSTKATAAPRTVYWAASFSTNEVPACAGLTPYVTDTTPVHTLVVLPASSTPPTATPPTAMPPNALTPVAPQSLSKRQKLAKALKICRRKRSRKQRLACEASARRRYGPSKAKHQ